MAGHDYFLKYIVLGDTGVGKTCLVQQLAGQGFDKDAPPTLGIEFGSKEVECDGVALKLQILDTAGHEQFKAITQSYLRGFVQKSGGSAGHFRPQSSADFYQRRDLAG